MVMQRASFGPRGPTSLASGSRTCTCVRGAGGPRVHRLRAGSPAAPPPPACRSAQRSRDRAHRPSRSTDARKLRNTRETRRRTERPSLFESQLHPTLEKASAHCQSPMRTTTRTRQPLGGIFIGGASRRMGRPKALLPVASGETLLERTVRVVSAAGLAPVLVGRRAELPELELLIAKLVLPVLADAAPNAGPLGGLVSLLEEAGDHDVLAPLLRSAARAAGAPARPLRQRTRSGGRRPASRRSLGTAGRALLRAHPRRRASAAGRRQARSPGSARRGSTPSSPCSCPTSAGSTTGTLPTICPTASTR